jgi:hypothetical protein
LTRCKIETQRVLTDSERQVSEQAVTMRREWPGTRANFITQFAKKDALVNPRSSV